MENTTQIKEFTRLMVTELVDTLAEREGTDWVLGVQVAGLGEGTHFRSRDELIAAVTQAYVEKFAARAGIRAA